MTLANSVTAYYRNLPPSIKYRVEAISPETMQDLWDGLIDGRDMLWLWLHDEGGDDRAIVPDSLNHLFDDVLDFPTNYSGTQRLRDDLIDQFGQGAFKNMTAGTRAPEQPIDPHSHVQDLWVIANRFYAANSTLPTWFRLNGIISALRNWVHVAPGVPVAPTFDRWLANAIRHRQPDCPLSWLPEAQFLCIYEVDTSEGCNLLDYTPPATVMQFFMLTESEEKSGLAYLDDEGETTWTNGQHRKWYGRLPFWAFDEMMQKWNFGIHDENGTVLVGIGESYPSLSANPYRPMSHHHAAQDMSVTPFPPFDPPKTAEEEQAVWEWLTKTLKELYP